MTKMKTVYLTWGETPRAYGIYRTQVAETVAQIVAEHDDFESHLIAGLPLIHSGLVREKLGYWAELRKVRAALDPVPLRICPIPVTQNFVYPTRRNFNVIFTGARFTLLPKLRQINPKIVHCRSFLATWIATQLRQLSSLDYRIIYDARSIWPEMQYRRRLDQADLDAFKALEKEVVEQVDAVVGVNAPMTAHYAEMGAKRTLTNYISAPLSSASAQPVPAHDGPLRLVYAGALYKGGMQTPKMLFELAAAVRKIAGPIHLTVLTVSPHAPLQAMAQTILGPDCTTFQAVKDPAQMPKLLAAQDIACNVYKRPLTEIDEMLCKTGLSTKSAEYLAAGLPILVSPYPEAVGALVADNDVGAIFDDRKPDFGISQKTLDALRAPEVRDRAIKLAQTTFDRRVVARKFAELYRELATQD